jgi:uncharacterized membrane protein YjjP (DUF1212 family)
MSESSKSLAQKVHDARAPLNKISMNAELVKLMIENQLPADKALEALQKIILACQECSQLLQDIAETN